MGASIWEQLTTSFNFSDVVLILLLCAGFVIVFIKGGQELLKILGLETRREREKREREKQIQELTNKIVTADNRITALEASAKKFNDDRVHDREQSFNYQHEYMDIVNGIYEKQDAMIERIDALAEQSRKYQLADMRETLLQAHRYYTGDSNPLKMWTEIEHHAWNEQYDVYISAKGNSYVEETVKPEMDALKIIYLNDYEGMSKLMASRSKNCN